MLDRRPRAPVTRLKTELSGVPVQLHLEVSGTVLIKLKNPGAFYVIKLMQEFGFLVIKLAVKYGILCILGRQKLINTKYLQHHLRFPLPNNESNSQKAKSTRFYW